MNKKLIGLVSVLFAFTLAACGTKEPSKEESKKQPESSQKADPSSEKESKQDPVSSVAPVSSKTETSSKAPSVDYLQVIPHTWADGTPATNADGKEYIPLTDAAAGKVGVKIAITNYTIESGSTATGMGSDGKINPGNDHGAYLTYKIKAPKAGEYQMVLRGKSASNALERTLDDRAFGVTLNGASVATEGDRTPLTETDADFVAAPTVNLTGNEDTFTITASDYRIQFDVTSFIIFAEH